MAVSCRGARKVDFTVTRTLHLRKPPATFEETPSKPGPSTPYSQGPSATKTKFDAPNLSQIQAALDLNRQDIDRIDTAGFSIVSALDEAVQRVETETNKLQKSVQGLREDFGGNQADIAILKTELKDIRKTVGDYAASAISRLESQIQSLSEAVPGVRIELNTISTQSGKDILRLEAQLSQAKKESEHLKGIVESNALIGRENTKELKSLRTDVLTLKNLPSQRPAPQPLERSTGFSNRGLDILTDNIARLGNRASQVETLQMQFEILKGRVERVEGENSSTSTGTSTSMTPAHPPGHRKRPHHDVHEFETYPDSTKSPRTESLNASSVKRPRPIKSGAVVRER